MNVITRAATDKLITSDERLMDNGELVAPKFLVLEALLSVVSHSNVQLRCVTACKYGGASVRCPDKSAGVPREFVINLAVD